MGSTMGTPMGQSDFGVITSSRKYVVGLELRPTNFVLVYALHACEWLV